MKLWCCINQPLQCYDGEEPEERCGCVDAGSRVNLTNPGTERGVSGMRRSVVSMARLFCVHNETACPAYCKSSVEQDHPDNERREPTLHFIPSRTCCTSATDSSLSQALGPTARPTARPSCVMSTVVGKPRTIKDLDTSSFSSKSTGSRMPR